MKDMKKQKGDAWSLITETLFFGVKNPDFHGQKKGQILQLWGSTTGWKKPPVSCDRHSLILLELNPFSHYKLNCAAFPKFNQLDSIDIG